MHFKAIKWPKSDMVLRSFFLKSRESSHFNALRFFSRWFGLAATGAQSCPLYFYIKFYFLLCWSCSITYIYSCSIYYFVFVLYIILFLFYILSCSCSIVLFLFYYSYNLQWVVVTLKISPSIFSSEKIHLY